MVYRTELLPNVNETARIWRNEAKKNGFKDLYLIRVENFKQDINPIEIGFDASMEFAPDWQCIDTEKSIINKKNDNRTHDYLTLVENMSMKPDRNFPWFRCVTPCWDNSPRKNKSATTFINNTPFEFEQFFYRAITFTKKKITEDSQFVFINAWNEWGEGCHLEPDKKNGYAYLEAIKNVLDDTNNLHVQNYIEFIERNLIESLRRKEEMKEELNLLKIPYEKIMNSKPHKFIEMVLKNYRYIKRNFKK
jgi:lipopolysaccharide biosynthesis protein